MQTAFFASAVVAPARGNGTNDLQEIVTDAKKMQNATKTALFYCLGSILEIGKAALASNQLPARAVGGSRQPPAARLSGGASKMSKRKHRLPLTTHEIINERNAAFWRDQSAVRERLTRALEKNNIELKAEHCEDLEIVVRQLLASRELARAKPSEPPEAAASRLGHPKWVPVIGALRRRLGKNAGGRPRHDEDIKILLRLLKEQGSNPDWKDICSKSEKETGKKTSPEACRSLIRRALARRAQPAS